jgi:hypothetical protein
LRSWNRIVALMFLATIFVGCNEILKSTVTAIPSPMRTRTLSLIETTTPAIEPTVTIPAGTLIALSTMDAIVTAKPELGEFYSHDCLIYSMCLVPGFGLSPNGQWAVYFSFHETGGLSIVNVNTKVEWNIYFNEIKGFSVPDSYVYIARWSKDGKYLYVTPSQVGEGGFAYFWRDWEKLIRINLDNGTWVDTKMGSAFSFSPNERFISYRLGQEIVVYEFQTRVSRKFSVPTEYKAFGRFVWSHDSERILFIGSINDLDQEERPKGFTLFLLNIDDMTVKTILEKDERYLYPLEWETNNLVLLKSLFDDNLSISGRKYKINLETNEVAMIE